MDATTLAVVALATVVLLAIARGVYQLIFGQQLTDALIVKDNRAAAMAMGGFMLGVINVIIPILGGPSHSVVRDLTGIAAYGIGGIAAMTVTGLIFAAYNQWAGLHLRECLHSSNVAAGVVTGGVYLAASQVVSGALTGDGGSLVPTVVFWLAGVAALVVITHLFRYLTAYDDAEMINQGNLAAAIGYAGLIVAIGMMVGYAVSGEFTGYGEGFRQFGLMLLAVLLLYPVRQVVVQMLLLGGGFSLRHGRLDHEIAEDKNVGAGLLEAVGYLATALIVTRIGA
jgi:uncharacterized membrane protein YjfL (UPF0719 family)